MMKIMKIILLLLTVTTLISCVTKSTHVNPITSKPSPVVIQAQSDQIESQEPVTTNTQQPLNMFVVMVVAVVASCACCVFYTRVVDRRCRQANQTDDSDTTTVING